MTDIHRKTESKTTRQADRQMRDRKYRKNRKKERQIVRQKESFIRHRETTGRATRITKENYRTRCTLYSCVSFIIDYSEDVINPQ